MEPRVTLMTLGVASVAASRAFYQRLGWRASEASQGGVAFFQLGPIVLSLFGRADLAADAKVADTPPGFAGISLAQNLPSIAAVDAAYAAALAAGAAPLKAPCTAFWGGYSGYFADPDGFCWELAYNPSFPLDGAGQIVLPA